MWMGIGSSILLQGLQSATRAIAIREWWRPFIARQNNSSICLAAISIMVSNRALLPNSLRSPLDQKRRESSLVIQAQRPLRRLSNWHVIIPNGPEFWLSLALFMDGPW